jgi:hypothetical protein
MKNWNVLLLVLLVAALPGRVLADSVERVATVETDAFSGSSYLDVIRADDGVLKNLIYRGHDGKVLTFTLDQLRSSPQVVKQMNGRDVVFLSVEKDFTAEKGGHGNMRFLQSGVSGTFRNFRILVDVQSKIVLRSDPNPQDPESDRNPYTTVFTYLFMKKSSFLGITTGIESVRPSLR